MDVPSCSSRQVVRAALRLGFVIKTGGRGSHTKLEYANGRVVIVPDTKDIGKGLRARIVNDIASITGRSREAVINMLSVGFLALIVDSLRGLFRS